MTTDRSPLVGAAWAVAAAAFFSTNDMLIKFLSGGYALHQVVLFRTLFGIAFLLGLAWAMSGGWAALRTKRPGMQILRGLAVVFANMCFFLSLAALPLAEAVAIFFVSPLVVAVFSVIFLGEAVGPRRWAAIGVGLLGVAIVLRPGTDAFQIAALLPIGAAIGYATLHILTRRLGDTETALGLAFHVQLVFLVTSMGFGLALGHGAFAGSGHPSLEFLFRAWVWPPPADLGIMALVGFLSAAGGYAISEAYRRSEAALVAPFEYVAMPLSVFWGFAVFGEWPDLAAWAGIALILSSGLALIWREAAARREVQSRPPPPR